MVCAIGNLVLLRIPLKKKAGRKRLFTLCNHEKRKSLTGKKKLVKELLGTEPIHSLLQKSQHYLTAKPSYLSVWLPIVSTVVSLPFKLGLLCMHS